MFRGKLLTCGRVTPVTALMRLLRKINTAILFEVLKALTGRTQPRRIILTLTTCGTAFPNLTVTCVLRVYCVSS